MAQIYSVTSGSVAGAAAGTRKVAVQLATGAQVRCLVTELSIFFTGVNAAAKPVIVEIVKPTAAGSGGAAFTPLKIQARGNAQTTARVNDTTPGASGTIYQTFFVPPTGGLFLQYPLGREWELALSDFWEVNLRWPTGETVVEYVCNVVFEE